MRRIATKFGVATVWLSAWLIAWPTMAASSLVLSVWWCLARLGRDAVSVHMFLPLEPNLLIPFVLLLAASTVSCYLVPRWLTVPYAEAESGGSGDAAFILSAALLLAAMIWFWLLTGDL